jgi:opacity protein-like surface antigen
MKQQSLHVFRQAFRAGDLRVDLNRDGRLDMVDVALFKQSLASIMPGSGMGAIGGVGDVYVWLLPAEANGAVGEPLAFDVHLDFTQDRTIGGAFDVVLVGGTGTLSWSFASSDIGDDPGFRREPDVTADGLTGIAVGDFDGITGPGVVGTLTFTPDVAGTQTLGLSDSMISPWVSDVTFMPQFPEYSGATLDITPEQQVPVGAGGIVLLAFALFVVAQRVAPWRQCRSCENSDRRVVMFR